MIDEEIIMEVRHQASVRIFPKAMVLGREPPISSRVAKKRFLGVVMQHVRRRIIPESPGK